MNSPSMHHINPEQAAHNIASSFCSYAVKSLPDSAFNAGDIESIPYVEKIWSLYASVYDSVFEMADAENNSVMEDE